MNKLIRLHLSDNVLTVIQNICAGEHLIFEDNEFYFDRPVTLGNKVAAGFIDIGEDIINYGMPVGSATKAIQKGDYVHLHNMKSNLGMPTPA